jgi:hypothetical protein
VNEKQKLYQKEYRLKNSEKLKKYFKEHYKENKEYIKLVKKEYQTKNSENIKIKKREYYIKNKNKFTENHKKYINKNKNYWKDYNKKYYESNKEKINKQKKEYNKKRLQTDPIYKMVRNIRSRIKNTLKSKSIKNYMTPLELFGASAEEVWKHLESQFKDGMTRENNNRKGWHIDHIKPISSFDLTDPNQLKECCHYKNLQPLWWYDNLSKGKKI